MTTTIEIPRFWVFRMPCGCVYGSLLADQRFPGFPDHVVATKEQAWAEFYEGEKRRGDRDQKAGRIVTAEDVLPPLEEFAHKTFVDGVCTVHEPVNA